MSPTQETCIIFVHIPKTAGTTFQGILRDVYGAEREFRINGLDIDGSIQRFIAMPESARSRVRLAQGHNADALRPHIPRPCHFITFLRDPVERVISHYYYWLRTPDKERPWPELQSLRDRNPSLLECLRDNLMPNLKNEQTFNLSGMLRNDFDRAPEEGFRVASQAIADFAVVGLTERFDDSLVLMRRRLNWKRRPFYVARNVTSAKPASRKIDRETLAAIEQTNQLDLELYRLGVARFERDLAEEGIGFRSEAWRFRLAQRLRDNVRRWKSRMRFAAPKLKKSPA